MGIQPTSRTTLSAAPRLSDSTPNLNGHSARTPALGEAAPRPFDLAQTILRRRYDLGLTQGEIAQRAGIAKSYVCQIENASRPNPPSVSVLRRLERALELSSGSLVEASEWSRLPENIRKRVEEADSAGRALREQLKAAAADNQAGRSQSLDALYRSGELHRLVRALEGAAPAAPASEAAPVEPLHGREQARPALPPSPRFVPVINAVAAGVPRERTDLGYPPGVADRYIELPPGVALEDPNAFAAKVEGDSMHPEYRDGDIVVFSALKAVANGADCFVRLEPDHESTFKRVYFESAAPGAGADAEHSGQLIRLQPLNPRYPARTVAREQVAGLYAAVSVTRML